MRLTGDWYLDAHSPPLQSCSRGMRGHRKSGRAVTSYNNSALYFVHENAQVYLPRPAPHPHACNTEGGDGASLCIARASDQRPREISVHMSKSSKSVPVPHI